MSDKYPWLEYPQIWPTKASFFTYLRGALRQALWNRYPPKLEFKKEQAYTPPASYVGKAKKLGRCSLTGREESISKLEVDHVVGNVSLKDWEDVLPFVLHLCASRENMQLVTKEAHKIKSYAERKGISFAEAVKEKEIISFGKKTPAQQIEILSNAGIEPAKTKEARKKQYRNLIKN